MFGRQKFKQGQRVTVTLPADEGSGSFDGVIESIDDKAMEVVADEPAARRLLGNWGSIPREYWDKHVEVRKN